MTAPAYTKADFAAALQALLPRGRAWPRDPSSTLTATLTALAKVYEDNTADALDLLAQAFPATAGDMLPEWESALSIDPPDTATIADRRRRVVAELIDTGGQSVAYFVALAAAMGFTITITQFSHYSVNSPVTTPIAVDEWAHTWRVNASAAIAAIYPQTADVVLATPGFGNPDLDGAMGAAKPAHTVVIMSYT